MVLSTSSPISGEAGEFFIFSDTGSNIVVPSASLIFKGDYERDGTDLVISLDGEQTVRIIEYFSHANPPALYSPEGTVLQGSVVEALAGPIAPGQYAQSGATASAAAIGQVEELTGTATVQRADGTVETLQVGTKVFQNDVVQTADGSSLSLTFVDGTIFTLASASRMILDELIYDPNSSDNSGVFNLVEGSFVFIAGQAAKTGGLEIKTPAATMGIRGTTVRVDITTENGRTVVEVSLNRDPDGDIGAFTITDLDGNEIATVTATDTKWIVSPIEGETREVPRSVDDLATDQILINQAVDAFENATTRVQQGGNFVENDGTSEQQEDGNDGDAPDGDQDEAPGDGQPDNAPTDQQQEDGGEEQDRSDLDSSGIEIDKVSFDGDQSDLSVDFPDLESDNVDVDPIQTTGSSQSQAGPQEDFLESTEEKDNIETGELPVDDITDDDETAGLSIGLPTLDTSVAEDGSIGISGFSIAGSDGGEATVTLTAGSTVTLAPGSGVEILTGTGENDEVVQFRGTFDQIDAALNGSDGGPSLTYSPSADADDTGTLDITVETDGETVSARLVIDIIPQQDPPSATDDTVSATEDDAPVSGNLLDNDSDPDVTPTPDTLTISNVSVGAAPLTLGVATDLPIGGTLLVNSNGSYSFDPAGDFETLTSGDTVTETISYEVSDGQGNFDTGQFTITITGQDDQASITVANFEPVAEGNTGVVNVVNFAPASVLAVDDVDGGDTPEFVPGSLSVEANSGSDSNSLAGFTINDEEVEVDQSAFDNLAEGQQGLYTVSFEVASSSSSTTQTSQITITGENDAPVATGLGLPTTEDTAVNGQLIASDVDNGAVLTFSADTQPANGSVIVNSDGSFTYTPNANFNGGDSFDFLVEDENGASARETVQITVNAENDVPTASAVPSDVSVDEDTPTNLDFSGIAISDVDSAAIVVTLDVDNGIFTNAADGASVGAGVSVTIDTLSSQSVSLSGSPQDITAYLNQTANLTFVPPVNVTGEDVATITVTADDGDGSGEVPLGSINVDVGDINDAPTLSGVPSDVTVTEDITSAINLTGIMVTDPDSGDLTVTLSVDEGTFSAPGVGSGVVATLVNATTITLVGSETNLINYFETASNIQYTGAANESGDNAALLTVSVSDGIAPAVIDTVNLDITAVNDAPTASNVPSDLSVVEDATSNLDFSGIAISDVDSTSIAVTLQVDNGIFANAADGTSVGAGVVVVFDFISGQSITLIGSAQDITSYLNDATNITYAPPADANGQDIAAITLTAEDTDGSGEVTLGTVNIDVTAANDAPTLTGVPSDVTVAEDTVTALDLSTVVVADVDGDDLTVTLSVDQGTFAAPATVTGITATLVNATTITLAGSAADINSYLDTASNVQYTGATDVSGDNAALLTVSVSDGTAPAVTDTVNIDITAVNDAPTLTGVPADVTVTEDVASGINLSTLLVDDVDGDELTVTLSIDQGTFSTPAMVTGVVATLVNASTITLAGSAADINSYLDTASNIQYTGATDVNGDNAALLTVSVSDDTAPAVTDTINIDITAVNDPPSNVDEDTLGGTITEGTGVSETTNFVAINFSDTDVNDTFTFSLNPLATNPMVPFNITFQESFVPSSFGGGRVEFDAVILNSELDQLAQGDSIDLNFTVTIDDGNGGVVEVGDPMGLNFTLTVEGTNDAPTIVNAPLSFGLLEDTSSDLNLSDIVIGDVDSNVTLTLSVDQGSLTASSPGTAGGVSVAQVDAMTITVAGAPAAVTTFLDGTTNVAYQGPLNATGTDFDTLTYSVSDGIAPAVTDTSDITLLAVNDDPTASGIPSDVTVLQNTESAIDLSGFMLADVDSADHVVTISVDTGVFTTVAPGSTVSPDLTVNLSMANFQTISIIGTVADINSYLNNSSNITYTGPTGVSGNDQALITISANDGDGSGSVQLGTVNVDITAVNTSPTITGAPSDITIAEDVQSNIDLSAVTVADAEGDDILLTLSVDGGTFAMPTAGIGVVVSLDSPTFISIEGSAANINTYLDTVTNIQYQGALDANGDNAVELTLTASDDVAAPTTETINIDISAVNDAPVFDIGSVPSTLTVNEDTFTFLAGLEVSDVDVGASDLTVTLQSTNGFFTIDDSISGGLIDTQITNNGTGNVTLVGTAAEINTTFDLTGGTTGIRFQGNQDVNGAGTITFTVDDGGATGAGGAQNDSVTINTNILADNDPPTATGVPSDIAVSENVASNVDLSSITLEDVDGDQLDVTIETDLGTFAAPASGAGIGAGVTAQLVAGDVVLTGSADDITTYLNTPANITLQTPGGTTGDNAGLLTISADDGSGAVTLGTVNIDVPTTNATPSFSIDGLTQSELVTNGDFEDLDPGFSTGANVVSPGDGTIPGFSVVDAPSRVLVGTNLGGGSGNAAIGLGGNPTGGSTSTVETTIETIAGRTYEITLNTSDPSNVTGNVAFLFVDTTAGENVTISNNSNPATLRFVADSTTTTIGVQAQFPTTNGLIIDNLSVAEVRPDNTFIAQEGGSTSLAGIVIEDDSLTSNFTVTLAVENGVLSDTNMSTPVTITGSGTNTLTLTGTLFDINNELSGGFVTYDGPAGFRGTDTLTITANDNDTEAAGGALTFEQTVDVVVGNTGSIVVGTNGGDLFNFAAGVTGGSDIVFGLNGANVGAFSTGNDVYIGGDSTEDVDGQQGDDFLAGGAGNDQLDGFSGNDTLIGGEGDDRLTDLAGEVGTYDGGTGQDTFIVSNAGTVDLIASAGASFTSIEAFDLNNSGSAPTANTLILNEDNIFDLSETSNTTLEGIVGEALPTSLLITADANDTVDFRINDSFEYSYQLGTPVSGFTIVELLDVETQVVGTIGVSNAASVVLPMADVPPELGGTSSTTAYLEGDPAVVVNDTITVTEPNGDLITGATITIVNQTTSLFETGDVLNFTDTANITGSYDETTGVLTLTGDDTAAAYQAALRSITFETSNDDVSDFLRNVNFTVTDGNNVAFPFNTTVNPTSVNDAPTIDVSGVRGSEIAVNGGFETPDVGSGFQTFQAESTAISGFDVGSGSVDVVSTAVFPTGTGGQLLDLDGDDPGSIIQQLSTEVGRTYEVTFLYTGNPDGTPGVREATVSAGNQTFDISFDTTGFTSGDVPFQTASFQFTAVDVMTDLSFESLSDVGSMTGILLDEVSVREVASTSAQVSPGGTIDFGNFVFEDPDGNPNNSTVTLSVSDGTIALGSASQAGLVVNGDGTSDVTVQGALDVINTFFANDVAFSFTSTGATGDVDDLTITLNDGGGFGQGVAESTSVVIPISIGSNTITGTGEPDEIDGTAQDDVIIGLDGPDILNGFAGNDLIIGDLGADTIDGGVGDDFLIAGSGADILRGGDGDDTLQSLSSIGTDEELAGGAGNDTIIVNDLDIELIDGETGRDLLQFFQSGNIDLRGLANGETDIIDGIEAISLENSEINTLFLDRQTLEGLSGESDTDLEMLLDQALTAGRTILGESNDTVNVETGTGFTFTENTALSSNLQDENGNQLDVYELVETSTGDVFSTVAIDEQVTVVTS